MFIIPFIQTYMKSCMVLYFHGFIFPWALTLYIGISLNRRAQYMPLPLSIHLGHWADQWGVIGHLFWSPKSIVWFRSVWGPPFRTLFYYVKVEWLQNVSWGPQHVHTLHRQPTDFNRSGVMLNFPCGGTAGKLNTCFWISDHTWSLGVPAAEYPALSIRWPLTRRHYPNRTTCGPWVTTGM